MFILICIIILLYLKNTSVAMLHYVMYTLTTGTSAHVTPLLLTPPAKRWWGIGVGPFCMSCVFVDPTPCVPFKILSPPRPTAPNALSCHNQMCPHWLRKPACLFWALSVMVGLSQGHRDFDTNSWPRMQNDGTPMLTSWLVVLGAMKSHVRWYLQWEYK